MDRTAGRQAFTLVELLTVIAVMVLLVGILVPAVTSARNHAKAGATRGTLKAISDGCEMFHGEMGKYPKSRGENPFEGGYGSGVYLSGAQWLALQLCGADLQGYVKPVRANDASDPPDGAIDATDWLAWYVKGANYTRLGPYVSADPELAQTPEIYSKRQSFVEAAPGPLQHGAPGCGSSEWSNARIPFFVDTFGYPILYYVAEPYANRIVSTDLNADPPGVGVYDQSDNAVFTGSEGDHGFFVSSQPGWDLGAGQYRDTPPRYHELGILGYPPATIGGPPDRRSFAHYIYDRNVYEMTVDESGMGGRIEPLRKDSFLLITPGADARYGTLDDVRNF